MHGKGKTAPRFHHAHPNTLYFHCILTFSCNIRVWRRTRPVSDRATVFDAILIAFLFYCTLQTLSRDVTSMETHYIMRYDCASRNSWPGYRRGSIAQCSRLDTSHVYNVNVTPSFAVTLYVTNIKMAVEYI